ETSEEEDVDQTTDDTLTKGTIKSDAEQLDNIIREQVKGKDIIDSRGQCIRETYRLFTTEKNCPLNDIEKVTTDDNIGMMGGCGCGC
ncbi:unnamed protein product, partial [Rotaria sordida]